MRTGRRWQVSLVCVVLMALLTPTAAALDFPIPGEPEPEGGYIVYDRIADTYDYINYIYDATVNFEDGSSLATWNTLQTQDHCVVNFYDCMFEENSYLNVSVDGVDPAFDGDVTFYGTEFKIDDVNVPPTETQLFLPNNIFSGLYENGEKFKVNVQCYEESNSGVLTHMTINLVWLGGPSVIDVDIDIKPDSVDNTINLGSNGVIPVGILSIYGGFDATTVNPETVALAGAGVAVRGKSNKLLSQIKDLNSDGLMDLEVKVETENLDTGKFQDGVAILTGQTYDGQAIQGLDFITIVPVE